MEQHIIHDTLIEMLVRPNWRELLKGFLVRMSITDFGIRRVLNALAVTQVIPLTEKDKLRKEIRTFYRDNYGDRSFFADSDLHRKHKRK